MQRLALALGVTAITLCCGSVTRAQTAFYPVGLACQPLPSWYPRGWELMVRYPCYYVYAPSYYSPAYYPYPAVYPHQRVSIRAHTGSIAGHICVPAGGGEQTVAPLLPALLRAGDAG